MSESADSPLKKPFAFLHPHEMYGVDAREERNFAAAIQILLPQPHEIFGVAAPTKRENGQDNPEDSNRLQRNTPVKKQLSDESPSNQAIRTEKSIPVHESQSMGQNSAHDSSEKSNKSPTKKRKLFCFCFRF